MKSKRFCGLCFAEKVENKCHYECPEETELKRNYSVGRWAGKEPNVTSFPRPKNEEWVEVKSPFKPYPPSEGV